MIQEACGVSESEILVHIQRWSAIDIAITMSDLREALIRQIDYCIKLEEMTEALNRGWGNSDSRSSLKLQIERAGVEVAVDPERLKAALVKDPEL